MVKDIFNWVRCLKFRKRSAHRATARALLMINRRQLGGDKIVCSVARSM